MAMDQLQALASAGPMAPAPAPMEIGGFEESPQDEVADESADETLGELAMAFKEATNPDDAKDLLLEFLTQAGFSRGGDTV